MREYWQAIVDRPWKPVSRIEVAGWLVFYTAFLFYAFHAHGGFLIIDFANLVAHEGGHNLFGWFGATLGLWGGTLLQWLVPFLLAAYFFRQRETWESSPTIRKSPPWFACSAGAACWRASSGSRAVANRVMSSVAYFSPPSAREDLRQSEFSRNLQLCPVT